jgi:O-antigen/teichoic acid export membrane protein
VIGMNILRIRLTVRTVTRGEREWLRRISGVLVVTLLGRLIGFLYPVLLLRQLDNAAAGLAFFFINSAYFVVQPVSGGAAMAMVSPIAAASTDDERAQWLRAAANALVPGVMAAMAVAIFACVTSNAPVLPMLAMVLGLSADTMYFQLLTARHRYAAAATYRLISNVAQLAALVVVLALGFRSVTLVVAIFAFSYVVGFAAVEPGQRVLLSLAQRAVSATRSQRRRLIKTAIPTAITGLAYSGITGADTYLVRLTHHDLVAPYGAAKTLAAPFLLVSLALATIVQPETARADRTQAASLRSRIIRLGAGGGAIAIAACWIFSGIAVRLVYGARYPAAVTTLSWLGAGTTLLGLHTLLQVWCWGRGQYVMPLISLVTGAGVAIAANLALVPRLGAPGGGVAMCIGAAVAMVLIVGLSSKTDLGDQPQRLTRATVRLGNRAS